MTTIQRIQTILGVTADGIWGPRSQAALDSAGRQIAAPVVAGGAFDARSEANIRTLVPAAQKAARAFLTAAISALAKYGESVRIISGTRTYAEQDAIYAHGRTAPGRIVTNARGGFSNHNFGIAWDVGIFRNGEYLSESPHYQILAQLGEGQGLDCGAFWPAMTDEPHYQLRTGLALAELRGRVATGKPIP
jgi:peptidoglycan L-alanyl-D-glutamate endopeptidase CwlK